MQVWFVISLFFSVVVAVFAVQNSDVVNIDLFWYRSELSQSLIILISAAFGAIITIFLGLFSKIKSSLKIRELSNELKSAEKKIELLSSSVKGYEQKNADAQSAAASTAAAAAAATAASNAAASNAAANNVADASSTASNYTDPTFRD